MFRRYADFIVNEVDMDGNVVHLTSLDLPPEMVCLSPHFNFTWWIKLYVLFRFYLLVLFVPMRCCVLFRLWRRRIKRKVLIMYPKIILLQLSLSNLFPVLLMQSVWKYWSIKSPQELMVKSYQLFLIQVLTNPRERYRFWLQSYIYCCRH